MALRYLRFIIAGEVADARGKFGGVGATLTDLARVLGLIACQDMETAFQFEKVQNALRSNLAREGERRRPCSRRAY